MNKRKKRVIRFITKILIFANIMALLVLFFLISQIIRAFTMLGYPERPQLELDKNPQTESRLFDSRFPDCFSGCWQGLRPGESSSDDVRTFFDAYVDDTPVNIPYRLFSDIDIYSGFMRETLIKMVFKKDELLSIDLHGPFKLNLSQILDELGNPEYYTLSFGNRNDKIYRVALTLYYPARGYIFVFNTGTGIISNDTPNQNEWEVCIDESILVYYFSVTAAGSIQDLLMSIALSPDMDNLSQDYWDYMISILSNDFMLGCSLVQID